MVHTSFLVIRNWKSVRFAQACIWSSRKLRLASRSKKNARRRRPAPDIFPHLKLSKLSKACVEFWDARLLRKILARASKIHHQVRTGNLIRLRASPPSIIYLFEFGRIMVLGPPAKRTWYSNDIVWLHSNAQWGITWSRAAIRAFSKVYLKGTETPIFRTFLALVLAMLYGQAFLVAKKYR